MDKKEEENIIIDENLKEGADITDVDLNDDDVNAILKEADIDVSQYKTLDFLNAKDDIAMKELLSGIDVILKKTTNPDHLIQKSIFHNINIPFLK